MKIRWINRQVKPVTDAKWLLFAAKYPLVLLLPIPFLIYLSYFFYIKAYEYETGISTRLYMGSLKLLYELFGKWGVPGFCSILILCSIYLFYFYAISKPKEPA
jgi:hypothetical protein